MRATLAKAGADVARLEFVALDLMRDDGWDEAVRDCRYLQHIASPFVTKMPADRMELIRPAVEGTTRALHAALAGGVERVVLTSSMAAVMYGHGKTRTTPFTAADWTDLNGRDVNAYVESKTRAERAAWDIMQQAGRRNDLVSVNPGGILGPLLDDDPGTSAALVARLLNGSVPAAPRIAFMIIDVRDVAALHVAAMTAPEAGGQRYPMSAGTYFVLQTADVLRQALPHYAGKLPRFGLPDWAVRLYALFDADIRGNLGELGVVKRTDALDARALLGRPFIAADDAIVATAQSLILRHLI